MFLFKQHFFENVMQQKYALKLIKRPHSNQPVLKSNSPQIKLLPNNCYIYAGGLSSLRKLHPTSYAAIFKLFLSYLLGSGSSLLDGRPLHLPAPLQNTAYKRQSLIPFRLTAKQIVLDKPAVQSQKHHFIVIQPYCRVPRHRLL